MNPLIAAALLVFALSADVALWSVAYLLGENKRLRESRPIQVVGDALRAGPDDLLVFRVTGNFDRREVRQVSASIRHFLDKELPDQRTLLFVGDQELSVSIESQGQNQSKDAHHEC